MSRKSVSCLVENHEGKVLLVQRGYGSRKGKWSLPGGFVDPGESSKRAAYRETKEETGLVVKIVATVTAGRTGSMKTFAARAVGGKLRYQRRECLDARFRDPAKIKSDELAFGGDRWALQQWAEMKAHHGELKKLPLPGACPHCGNSSVRLRRDPHHKPYRCRSCDRTF